MPVATFTLDPKRILLNYFCLSSLSKNLQGKLKLLKRKRHKCGLPKCATLTTVHRLLLRLKTHEPCDAKLLRLVNGNLVVRNLVTAFEEDGLHRGIHAGDFTWVTPSAVIVGRMSGLTRIGTHRAPPFKPCQTCDDPYLEGQLSGTVTKGKEPLRGCKVVGAYRLLFRPNEEGGEGPVKGTLEGVLICPCRR